MASSDEAKVKISADISAFNSAISSAKSTVTELNSALKLIQTQMNANGTSTDQLQNKLTTLQQKSSALKSEEDALKQKLEATVDAYGENSTEAQKLQTQLNNVQTQEARCEAEIQQTTKAIEDQQKAEEQANSASGKLVTTISEQEKELAELKQQYTNVVLEEGKDSEAAQELAGKITTLNGELKENKQKLADAEDAAEDLTKEEKELGEEGEEAGNKMADGFDTAYQALAGAGLIEAAKKLTEAMKACVEVAGDFEAQMSTVQALSGATTDDMNRLSAAAKEMGSTTSFTATEAGEALEYMALAGWETDEMLDGLSGVINLAAAAGEDLGTTTDIVTDALTAFGLGASDSAHFADVLAAASTNSNTTVSQMGEAFKQVATTAGTLGYSIDDVSVALGLMADNGIKGSSAGTALSTALTRMSGANATATAEMEKLNISMYNADGSTKDLSQFLGELRTALNENCTSSEDMQVALYNLAGQKGMKGLAAIVNTSDEDFAALTESINTCEGSAEEMADIKLDNFQGSVTLLKSAWDGLMTTMGEGALGALSNVVDMFTTLTNKVNEFLSNHEGLVKGLDAMAVGAVAAAAALGVMAVATSALQKAVEALNKAIDANPMLLLASALTGVVVGITAFIAMAQDADTELAELKDATKALTQEAEDQAKAWDELKSKTSEQKTSYAQLVTELEELLAAEEKDGAKKGEIQNIVNQLNDGILDGALAYDSETDSINMNNDALEALIQTRLDEESYNSLLEMQSALMDDVAEAQARVQQATEDTARVTDESYGTNAISIAEYTRAQQEAEDALEQLQGELDDVNNALNDYADEQEAFANSTEGRITVAVEDLGETLIGLKSAYDEAYQSAYDSISGQFDLWEEVGEVVTQSSDDIMAALESQEQYFSDYADNMENLMDRNIEGLDELVAAYGDGSVQSAGYIASMAAMTDEELEAMIAEMERVSGQEDRMASTTAEAYSHMSSETEAAIKECVAYIEDLDQSEEARQAAYDTLAGYVSGLTDEEGEVSDEMMKVAEDALEMFAEELGTASPSYKTQEMGGDVMVGYENGVENESGNVDSTMTSTAQDALDAFKAQANSTSLVSSGKDTISGYMTGSDNQKSSAASTLSGIATNAIQTFQKDSNSSTLQGAGSDTITGYQTGANSQSGATQTKLRTIAQNAITAFKNVGTSSALTSSGQDTISGYMTGASGKAGSLTSAMSGHAQNAIQAFRNNSTSSSLNGAGADAIQGAINGANSKGTSFTSTMKSIATNAMSAFKAGLGTASPSWIAEEAAENVAEGAIIGAEDSSGDLSAAFSDLAGSAMGSFQESLNTDTSLQAMVNGDNIVSMYDYLASRMANMATDIQIAASFDYDKLAESMAKLNMTVSIGTREFGRVVREVI